MFEIALRYLQRLRRRGEGAPASYYEHWRYIHQRLLNSSRVLVLLDLVGAEHDDERQTDDDFFQHESLMRYVASTFFALVKGPPVT